MSHSHENTVLSRHPLKISFADYIGRLSDEQRERRLGKDGAQMHRDGVLDTSRYIPPVRGERYTITDLKNDDIASFKQQQNNEEKNT